jgi:signal transduction histidine kinase/CheY-like chemotaxis protein
MGMDELKTIELSCALARPDERQAAAARLARHLGADALVLLVRDPELNAFVPAPGLPQTLPGGGGWRDLLDRCETAGEHSGEVPFPDKASLRPVLALSTDDGLVFALIGPRPGLGASPRMLCLPLLAAALRAEVAAEAARGRERSAHQEVRHAATLTAVLDATRADLERSLGETSRLNAQLKSADQAKDEFLAMLAHELRNPLSPIVSALDLLRRQGPGAPSFGKLLDVIDRQARHLTRLVDDLLDVSRITRGVIELRRDPIHIRSVLLQAIDSVRPLIESENHTLSLSIPDAPIFVLADAVRLTQVFSNLLTNAAKYMSPGGRIDLSVALDESSVAVRVGDTGIGIEKDMLPRIFDLFIQAPQALDRSKGGLGIGLTLVRRLVALHGGSVEARSEGAGKGSEFVVRLPVTIPPPQKRHSTPPRVRSDSERLLLVEDNADAAEMLAETLRLSGFTVRTAIDGEAGLSAALEFLPHIIVVDIGLPKMDGYAFAEQLRARLPAVKMVALSGYGGEEYQLRGKGAGFDAWLVKPVELEELLGVLGSIRAGN